MDSDPLRDPDPDTDGVEPSRFDSSPSSAPEPDPDLGFSMSGADLTPMMRQYRELKARDPEALLLFRMGDFYEMFGEDAERAGALLGLAVTTRDKGPNAQPMAGFPHPALESYLAKLVRLGVRAAVCEQMEDPRQAKGLVKREVVRVVTPGTLTDDALLDPLASNYLAAVAEIRGRLGLAWVELSTARFQAAPVHRRELLDEIARLNPAEILISEQMIDAPWARSLRASAPRSVITPRPSWDFVPEQAVGTLRGHFGVTTLAGFGIEDDAIEATAAGALVSYLRETQKSAITHLYRISPHRPGATLALDEMTRRGLELTRTLREGKREGSLLHVIDRASTAMGSRLLAEWLNAPLTDPEEIRARHDAVGELVADAGLREDLRRELGRAQDLERLAGRVGTGRATPRDLVGIERTLSLLPRIKARLGARRSGPLRELEGSIDPCEGVRDAIGAALAPDPPLALKEGGLIRAGHHPLLDELRDRAKGGKSWITNYQASQIARTGIPNLKVGFNKVFGYYIEVTNSHVHKVPSEYIRKQTIKNAERYKTNELQEYEDKILRAEDRARELEYELFVALRDRVSAEAPRLVQVGAALARLDALTGLAELAATRGYCRPEIVSEPVFEVEAGRHPVLDATMPQGRFVPNDTRLAGWTPPGEEAGAGGGGAGRSDSDSGSGAGSILLITGPNMAGKSTYIRQAALLALLAQSGSFVPAARARIGLVDRLFARVGATDELGRGQSTFMVEMTETANILNNATSRSLVILDEIGRGTSTFDGISLAWAIAEHLHDAIGCRTLFATHYHELVELERAKPRLRNANVAVRERDDDVVFLHRIVPGGADQSYGIHVARLAGVPQPVLERAKRVLAFLERQHSRETGAGAEVGNAGSAEFDPGPGGEPGSRPAPGPAPRARSARALRNPPPSLFAALPDPMLEELRALDLEGLTPEGAIEVLRRLKALA